MIETLNNLNVEEMCLSIIEGVYDKPTANILNDEKLNAFPLRLGKRKRCSLSQLLLNIVLEILVRAIRQEKEIKDIQIGKEETILSLLMIYVYIVENSENTIKKH